RHWMHNGFVEVGGEKMSKSLGNFTNLQELIDSGDPRAYRLLVLRSHYRSPVEINRTNTEDASRALSRLDALARRAGDRFATAKADDAALEQFRARMDDDLDTPGAMDVLFTTVRQANQAFDDGDLARAESLVGAVREICEAVGLRLRTETAEVPDEIRELARRRDEARAAKRWAEADALRDEIAARGFVVEDRAEGTVVRPA
ncbi:MAG: hypothetical protein N2037_14320, partial [Acidimicrobiales bacterium]|nr:hypothetical protein [Acidimicrobiales bacterium]